MHYYLYVFLVAHVGKSLSISYLSIHLPSYYICGH